MVTDQKMKGFTLLELMITVTVAGLVLSVGIPSFNNFVQNSRAVTHTNDMVTAINLARSESTRRSTRIELCSSTDGATCGGDNDWSTGWIIRRMSDGEVLRAWPARAGGAGVLSGNVSEIQFQPRGMLAAGVAPLMQVRLPHCSGDQGRDLAINLSGRITLSRVTC